MSLFFLCWVLQSLSEAAGVKRETSTTEGKNRSLWNLKGIALKTELETRSWDDPRKAQEAVW